MTLRELLDMLRRDMLRDTSDRVSGDSDQLWTDTTLIRYIDQAQRRFARRSLCIRDNSTSAARFVTQPFVQDYTLDPSIITVYSIRSLGNGEWINGAYVPGAYDTSVPPVFIPSAAKVLYPDETDLRRTGHADQRARMPGVDWTHFDVNNSRTICPGKPLVFESDETMAESGGSAGVVSLRLYPMPDADYAGCKMQMRVSRLPAVRLTPADLSVVPEIPEDYHGDMLDWAAYLALRIDDHEAGDPVRAQEFKQAFEAHVVEAREEILRKTFAPMTWGFGGGGYGYAPN